MENFKKINKVFFVGIGGIGVSALSKLYNKYGKKVAGSDKHSSEITKSLKKQGIKIFIGHNPKNLDLDTDLLIYSSAVNLENPERKKASKLGIKQLSYSKTLGLLSKNKFTIAVSGTHGKSTTTAMLGLILAKAGLDPTVIVGSKIKYSGFSTQDRSVLDWNENLRIGKSKYFVVEACEWRAHMLELEPEIIILTNIEADHLDYYKTFKNLKNSFKEYVKKIPKNGLLIINRDDKNCLEIAKSAKCKVVSFGIKNKKADVTQANLQISLQIPGQFNIYNGLAAACCALNLKIKHKIIKKTLSEFSGIWRRFERLGQYHGALMFSDYAHHPTAIYKTLEAAKITYPKKRLIVVFQPHHVDRVKRLFKKFAKAFDLADLVILSEIYNVPGRSCKKEISSEDLAKKIKIRGINIIFTKNVKEAKTVLLKNIRKKDLILIMGAGDIYKVFHKTI